MGAVLAVAAKECQKMEENKMAYAFKQDGIW
jgi:hypothetical protein